MQILIIGGGGREHALAWKCAQSPRVQRVYIAPGNAGTAREARCENVAIAADDIDALLRFADEQQIELTIVGPEVPLVLGVVDRFRQANRRCFGPVKAAAQLEGSKAYTKTFLARHNIPTAAYHESTDYATTAKLAERLRFPCVLKADGLAAGKGVVIAQTREEFLHAAREFQSERTLGDAGVRVIVEDFLEGEEASFIVMVDGKHVLPMATSQDHKRINDGDQGPNTGGMGAYSPAPVVTSAVHERVMREIIEPTVAGLAKEGTPYVGFLYAGLMIAPDGAPKVIEFNCRFGDPETQPIMMRLRSDLVDLVEAALDGQLDQAQAKWDTRPAVGVVMAAGGYPGTVRKGDVVAGLPAVDAPDAKVFHAGTVEHDGAVVTSGGRVLCVTALGATVSAAQLRAYSVAKQIHWTGAHYRRDIGYRAIVRESGRTT
jgi:phosphoribosylamine---glycine ligase